MFKKRVFKRNNENAKRKLDLQESDTDTDSNSDKESKRPSNEFKKRKMIGHNSTNEPKSTFEHTKETKGSKNDSQPKELLSNPSLEQATIAKASSPSVGPLKPLPQNIKTTTITDFQPDVCKDFLQTGYCGYGDTCKFLHVRDESRQKKPIEKEWENVTKTSKKQEAVPFKCVLCKKDYQRPVKTQCNHLFCQPCFLERLKVKKKSKCFICGKETNGIFSPVSKKELDELINSEL